MKPKPWYPTPRRSRGPRERRIGRRRAAPHFFSLRSTMSSRAERGSERDKTHALDVSLRGRAEVAGVTAAPLLSGLVGAEPPDAPAFARHLPFRCLPLLLIPMATMNTTSAIASGGPRKSGTDITLPPRYYTPRETALGSPGFSSGARQTRADRSGQGRCVGSTAPGPSAQGGKRGAPRSLHPGNQARGVFA